MGRRRARRPAAAGSGGRDDRARTASAGDGRGQRGWGDSRARQAGAPGRLPAGPPAAAGPVRAVRRGGRGGGRLGAADHPRPLDRRHGLAEPAAAGRGRAAGRAAAAARAAARVAASPPRRGQGAAGARRLRARPGVPPGGQGVLAAVDHPVPPGLHSRWSRWGPARRRGAEGEMATLVTGGTGFIGVNVVRELAAHGHAVVSIDVGPPDALTHRFLEPWRERVTWVTGDVLDAALLERVAADHPIERIVHAAAYTPYGDQEQT